MAPPKETREFNGKSYVMEEAIFGDYAFVKVGQLPVPQGAEQLQRSDGQEREDDDRGGR
jgi:hypothetical protein